MYTVIDMGQLAKYGVTYWLTLASAANMAQGASCLAVAIKSKNAKTKSMAFPSALSCMLGITEPAIFGVNLRFLKPFIFGAVGGACGAMAASILGVSATGTGVTGIFAILLALNNPIQFIISMAIAMAVAFVLTWLFGTKNIDGEKPKNKTNNANKAKENTAAELPPAEEGFIASPLSGKVVALKDVPDQTFAEGVLGLGAAIEPDEGVVVAPADGVVGTMFDTHHAVGLVLDSGAELLIHVGINTVELEGKGYTAHVSEGDRVKRGQKLITFDIDFIKKQGYPVITPVIVGNTDDYSSIELAAEGTIKTNERLIAIKK